MSWLRVLAAVAAIYSVYCALAFAFQRDLIFPGRRRGAAPAAPPLPEGLQQVWLEAGAERVEAYHWPASGDAATPAPALIFAHGNAELIDHWPRLLAAVRSIGASATVVEYPGYGRSGGSPSEASIARAMAAAYDWLVEQPHVDRARMVAYGRSLGGGAACALARKRPLSALILQSTFTDLRPFANGMGLPSALLRDPFDNRSVVAGFDGPVLIMHGDHDDIIPYSHGKALADAARRGRLITYRCRHNDCPPDLAGWVRDQRAFLEEHGLL